MGMTYDQPPNLEIPVLCVCVHTCIDIDIIVCYFMDLCIHKMWLPESDAI